jgi:C1A family cysteine protease
LPIYRGFSFVYRKITNKTSAEFKALYTGLKQKTDAADVEELPSIELPASVDWRKEGAVTPVKNQGKNFCRFFF